VEKRDGIVAPGALAKRRTQAVLHLAIPDRHGTSGRPRGDRHIVTAHRVQKSAHDQRPRVGIAVHRGYAAQIQLGTRQYERHRERVIEIVADIRVQEDRDFRGGFGTLEGRRTRRSQEQHPKRQGVLSRQAVLSAHRWLAFFWSAALFRRFLEQRNKAAKQSGGKAPHSQLEARHFTSSPRTSGASPPLGVIAARMAFSGVLRRKNRIAPSAMAACTPSSNRPPSFGSGPRGSYGRSCGLVHGTASPASTTRNVQ